MQTMLAFLTRKKKKKKKKKHEEVVVITFVGTTEALIPLVGTTISFM
jgi:hypothetical protein